MSFGFFTRTFKLVSPAFSDVVEEFFTNARTLNVLGYLLSALSALLGRAAFVDTKGVAIGGSRSLSA